MSDKNKPNEPGTDTMVEKVTERLRKQNEAKSEFRWNHWLVILTGVGIIFAFSVDAIKSFVLTPYVLDVHTKLLDAHDESISALKTNAHDSNAQEQQHERTIMELEMTTKELQKTGAETGNRLIRIEDKLDTITLSLQRLDGGRHSSYVTNLPPMFGGRALDTVTGNE